eukprot:NODE_666_length_5382_cov_0.356048.p2 type:complete len:335 gc:universal NODE_666_length_5382_cov_0.356048:5304-4300(-)
MLKKAIQGIANQISDPHFLEVIKNNLSNGKLIRGSLTISVSKELNNSNLFFASLLGASVEYLQSSYLILDDIMDQSDYRRGHLAWHKQVGLSAINDGIFLRELIHSTLSSHFKDHSNYLEIVDLFNNVHLCTMFGQHLDMKSDNTSNSIDISHSTHFHICQYKTSYYTFYLPIMLALLNANVDINQRIGSVIPSLPYLQSKRINKHFISNATNFFPKPETLAMHVHELSIDMGYYFQSQDDMLDILPKDLTGKDQFQDVNNNKTTWLKSELHRLTAKSQFKKDEQIQLYSELDIKSKFQEFEQKLFDRIQSRLAVLDFKFSINSILDTLRKRSK